MHSTVQCCWCSLLVQPARCPAPPAAAPLPAGWPQARIGTDLGKLLIKWVVEALRAELPQLQHYVTLSPIPNFAGWLATQLTKGLAAPAAVTAGGSGGAAAAARRGAGAAAAEGAWEQA